MIRFLHPAFLYLLVLIPLYLIYEWKFLHKRKPRINHSLINIIRDIQKRNSFYLYVPILIKSSVIILIVLALARPQRVVALKNINTKGVDIVFALDISGSMLAVDFQPVNRIEAAKKLAAKFISKRENDRIGLVTFAEYAYTQAPLTLDYEIIQQVVKNLEVDKEQSGTAIGNGIATAVTRLKDSKAKSKVIILITDGRNNAGEIDPFTAADLAKTLGIKIYCVAVGSNGPVDYPFEDPIFGIHYEKVLIDMDVNTLNKIALITGTGKASIATNSVELERILGEINRLEKTDIKQKQNYEYVEIFHYLLMILALILILDILYRTILRKELP
jgi:Ca-activated chloride channel family protein